MKKKYIRPESQLLLINLTENIAYSSDTELVEYMFSHNSGGSCNTNYQGHPEAYVNAVGKNYMDDILSLPGAVALHVFMNCRQ